MRYFLDTEFSEVGPHQPIQLISIGIVRDDGREFYAESGEFNRLMCNDWVKTNVLPGLRRTNSDRYALSYIAKLILDFVGEEKPEFWGYYADYDWVVFCQIFGSMVNLPKGWPMYCRDIKQWCDSLDDPRLPVEGYVRGQRITKPTGHNALDDAHWIRLCWYFLAGIQQARDLALARSLD